MCIGAPEREGTITIVGAVSPPGGDFTDPVTSATLSIVQVFWGLDKKLAQRKHFPSINWTISFSKYIRTLEPYLGARLASFYERAGRVMCIGAPEREGTITIVGAVSPPGGDFTDPVTSATLSIVQVFWGLDKKLAQRKHFPSINWTISFSKYIRVLEPYMEEAEPEYLRLQQQFREILQSEDELQEIVQLVGKDSLSEDQKCTLETARIIREDFLQQNGFSEYDFMCTLPKTIGMMKVIGHFHDCAMKAITETGDRKIVWSTISTELKDTIVKVTEMKFEKPRSSKEYFKKTFNDLCEHITVKFRALQEDH